MIKVMVVYDEDPLYAGRLAEYVNQKETFPFQAMAFSDLEKLKAYGRDHEIAILLVGERVREEAKEIKAGLKMLLCDGEFVSQEEASVYKFQSGDCILQEVMACYCTVPPEPGLALIGKRALIMGVYSPIGRCGKTSFSLTLAHMLGKSQGVLFISLEEYSGFSKLVCGGYEQDLSDVFYLYRQGDFNWLKLKSLILSHGNVDYIPPAAYGEDLDQAQPEEIAGLLKQIGTESGYERIVVDMGHMGKGALELFAACNMYLGAVFRYYHFLALEDVLPMLKVLRVKKVSYFDSMGVNHQNAVNSFKGFFKEEEPNLEEITSEEIQELINACTNDRDRLLIAMMAETGLRLGEILGIHYTEDIDFERRTVRVRYRESNTNLARAKNAEYRMALLSNTTFEFLVKYISDNRKSLMNSEYLFTKLTGKNKGEPLDADSVYSMLKRLSKKTDINSHPHQLRHYFAEERRKEGWDLNDIRFALGHKKVETTIKYLGENNERLIEATDQYYSNNEDLYQIADFL